MTASVLAVAAVGLSLQLGITNYINFAYGDFMALGAYIAWELNAGIAHLTIWIALPLGALAIGLLAVVLNQILFGPFTRRFAKPFYILIVTFGLSLIVLNLINAIWGASVRQYQVPAERALHVGPFLLTASEIVVMAVAIMLVGAIHLLLSQTKLGKSMRAMSDNSSLAMTSGINTSRITMITWFLSGAIAGLAGTILGITAGSLTPSSGETFLFVIFASVIVGGVGSVYGAVLGALLIGQATEISAVFINPAYKLDTAFVILIVVILFRPSGLFARLGKA